MYNRSVLYSIHFKCVYNTTSRTAVEIQQLAVDTRCSSQFHWILKTQPGICDVQTFCTYIAWAFRRGQNIYNIRAYAKNLFV